ncbi:MAG: polyprenyl synthetase family protein [Acidobacteria bacterium]|nr:polyprenyl synthetase family protein [Acidobacteriota bacterium]
MNAVAPLAEYLGTRRAQIEDALARFLPSSCPPVVYEAMRYSLLAGGKRLRPILTLAAAETVAGAASPGQALQWALPAACAIEFIHTYSLIHDDLPAMDNDSLRRGRPTLHIVHGEGMAILAGDGLLTEAFALMANEPRDPALTARKLRTIGVVATAAGAIGMVGGQALDLQAVGSAATLDALSLQDMHVRKTGALIRAAASAGAIMAGGDEDMVRAVEEYGRHLGLAFQIVDDILDVEGEAKDLGKTAGKDAKAGKPTYPSLYGLEASRRLASERMDSALAGLRAAGLPPGRLGDLAVWMVTRSN